jgi:hypothetical protein
MRQRISRRKLKDRQKRKREGTSAERKPGTPAGSGQ